MNLFYCDCLGAKEFGHQYTLMRHLPTHTDERKFQCNTCGKGKIVTHRKPFVSLLFFFSFILIPLQIFRYLCYRRVFCALGNTDVRRLNAMQCFCLAYFSLFLPLHLFFFFHFPDSATVN